MFLSFQCQQFVRVTDTKKKQQIFVILISIFIVFEFVIVFVFVIVMVIDQLSHKPPFPSVTLGHQVCQSSYISQLSEWWTFKVKAWITIMKLENQLSGWSVS